MVFFIIPVYTLRCFVPGTFSLVSFSCFCTSVSKIGISRFSRSFLCMMLCSLVMNMCDELIYHSLLALARKGLLPSSLFILSPAVH